MMFSPQRLLKLFIIGLSIFLISIGDVNSANLLNKNKQRKLKIFYTQQDIKGWDAVLKGEVMSFGQEISSKGKNITGNVHGNTKVIVRLYSSEGLKKGDTLFVINSSNLITARIKVNSIFNSKTFGYILTGKGNFQYIRTRDLVAQRSSGDQSKYAFVYSERGDYYQEIGQTGKAISLYKKAIELDKGNPDAHLSLGYIYLNNNMLNFAYKEFYEAYKEIGRLYDLEDKYLLLKRMAETRYKEAYYQTLPDKLRTRYINDGIKYSKEALRIYPESKEVNFYLANFYYKNPEPSDVKARNQFLKVISLDPDNIDAHIALAELYYKYRNKKKSKFYAEKALKIDPANERAKSILKISVETIY